MSVDMCGFKTQDLTHTPMFTLRFWQHGCGHAAPDVWLQTSSRGWYGMRVLFTEQPPLADVDSYKWPDMLETS